MAEICSKLEMPNLKVAKLYWNWELKYLYWWTEGPMAYGRDFRESIGASIFFGPNHWMRAIFSGLPARNQEIMGIHLFLSDFAKMAVLKYLRCNVCNYNR